LDYTEIKKKKKNAKSYRGKGKKNKVHLLSDSVTKKERKNDGKITTTTTTTATTNTISTIMTL